MEIMMVMLRGIYMVLVAVVIEKTNTRMKGDYFGH